MNEEQTIELHEELQRLATTLERVAGDDRDLGNVRGVASALRDIADGLALQDLARRLYPLNEQVRQNPNFRLLVERPQHPLRTTLIEMVSQETGVGSQNVRDLLHVILSGRAPDLLKLAGQITDLAAELADEDRTLLHTASDPPSILRGWAAALVELSRETT
jgi:hypothetical protein